MNTFGPVVCAGVGRAAASRATTPGRPVPGAYGIPPPYPAAPRWTRSPNRVQSSPARYRRDGGPGHPGNVASRRRASPLGLPACIPPQTGVSARKHSQAKRKMPATTAWPLSTGGPRDQQPGWRRWGLGLLSNGLRGGRSYGLRVVPGGSPEPWTKDKTGPLGQPAGIHGATLRPTDNIPGARPRGAGAARSHGYARLQIIMARFVDQFSARDGLPRLTRVPDKAEPGEHQGGSRIK
jgi:hypothetical protein